MKWICKSFDELTLTEFHNIIKLRIDVFVVEQECVYRELDNKDQKAFHLFAFAPALPLGREQNSDQIIAYSRIFKPGDYFKEASFGRVVVHPDYRKEKLGYKLVEKIIDFISKEFDFPPIKISAQTYLKKLYNSFSFKQVGEEYLDEGIPHIDMLKE